MKVRTEDLDHDVIVLCIRVGIPVRCTELSKFIGDITQTSIWSFETANILWTINIPLVRVIRGSHRLVQSCDISFITFVSWIVSVWLACHCYSNMHICMVLFEYFMHSTYLVHCSTMPRSRIRTGIRIDMHILILISLYRLWTRCWVLSWSEREERENVMNFQRNGSMHHNLNSEAQMIWSKSFFGSRSKCCAL